MKIAITLLSSVLIGFNTTSLEHFINKGDALSIAILLASAASAAIALRFTDIKHETQEGSS